MAELFGKVLIGAPAAVLVALSFAMNAHFWASVMAHDAAARNLWVAFSITSGAFKIGIPIYLELTGRRWRDRQSLAILFAVALVFDVLSGLGFSALTRGEAAATRHHEAAPVVELERRRDAAHLQLDRVAYARLTERLETERDAAAKRAPNCQVRKYATGDACKAVADLDAELVDARERDRLQKIVADLSAKISTAEPAPADVDPQIAAIVAALRAVNVEADPETVTKVFGVLVVLLIELGSVAASREVFARRAAPVAAAPVPVHIPLPVSPPVAAPKPAARPRRARVDLLDVIRAASVGRLDIPGASITADGWLYVSQRALADVTGLSPPTVSRQLKAAEHAALLSLRTDGRGSALKIIDPSISASKVA